MSERLRHLQRQQALLREHLAWIENEIARETANATEPVAPAATNAPVVANASLLSTDADALIERYAAEERQNPADIRRGCLMVFFLALLLIAGAVTAAWVLFYR